MLQHPPTIMHLVGNRAARTRLVCTRSTWWSLLTRIKTKKARSTNFKVLLGWSIHRALSFGGAFHYNSNHNSSIIRPMQGSDLTRRSASTWTWIAIWTDLEPRAFRHLMIRSVMPRQAYKVLYRTYMIKILIWFHPKIYSQINYRCDRLECLSQFLKKIALALPIIQSLSKTFTYRITVISWFTFQILREGPNKTNSTSRRSRP